MPHYTAPLRDMSFVLFDLLDAERELADFGERYAGVDRATIEAIARISRDDPATREQVVADGAAPLTEFAGVGNAAGVARLLELGVPVDARYAGDGYWELAPGTTALLNAAWRLREVALRVLLEAGADVNARDEKDRTSLQMAVRACTTSYWSWRRSPAVVAALWSCSTSSEFLSAIAAANDRVPASSSSARPYSLSLMREPSTSTAIRSAPASSGTTSSAPGPTNEATPTSSAPTLALPAGSAWSSAARSIGAGRRRSLRERKTLGA